jgi:hypothetical protein
MMRGGVLSGWRSWTVVGALVIAVCGTFVAGCDGGDSGVSEDAIDNCVETMDSLNALTSVQALYNSGAVSQRAIIHAAQLAGGVSEEAYEPVFGEKGNATPDETIRAWEAVRGNVRVASAVGGLLLRNAPESYEYYENLYEKTCHDILDENG